MGNMCQNDKTISTQQQPPTDSKPNYKLTLKKENLRSKDSSRIIIPSIHPKIKHILQLKQPYEQQFRQVVHKCSIKRLDNNDIYYGQTNQLDIPHGRGKLYKQNGDLIISQFINGVPNGQTFYISTNQVYYQGTTINGMLNCQKGLVESPMYKYEGGFKDNKFNDKGYQITEQTKFQGTYLDGKKKHGKLTWINNKELYTYQGHFNQNQQFTQKGILIQPFGRYQGTFQNGMKHGEGIYYYNSQLRYQGEYRYGKKWGKGKIINLGDTLCYQGEFQNGLPSGHGKSYKNNKVIHQGIFVQGIIKLPQ